MPSGSSQNKREETFFYFFYTEIRSWRAVCLREEGFDYLSQVTEMAASHASVQQKLSKMAEIRLDCVISRLTASHSGAIFTKFSFVFRFHLFFHGRRIVKDDSASENKKTTYFEKMAIFRPACPLKLPDILTVKC